MMTELEERLAQPDGVTLQAELLHKLAALAHRTRQRLAGGMPREDYMLWQKTSEAILAAEEIVVRWPVATPDNASFTKRATPRDTRNNPSRRP